MRPRLLHHIESIRSVTLRDCCRRILDTPEFLTWPASLRYHHAYEGGLLAHTVEVCDLALGMSELTCNLNLTKPRAKHDILIAAALWHDFAKVREYEQKELNGHDYTFERMKGTRMLPVREAPLDSVPVWIGTDNAKCIHHIPGSAIEFTVAARESGVDESVIEQVQHCILAHHGRREWGSPVEPQTLEALILHQADMTSAQYGVTAHQPTP